MKTFTFNLFICSFIFLFLSCGNDNIKLSKKHCVLSNDQKYVKINVSNAPNGYELKSTNDQVAIVVQPDVSADHFYIAGKGIGNADIIVSDKNDKGNTASVSVRINEYIYVAAIPVSTIYLKTGATKTLYFEKQN